jgi:hypothetical protein
MVRHREAASCGVSQMPSALAARPQRHLRDINRTSILDLLVSLCLWIAVRARGKRGGNPETGHEPP